MCAAAASSRPHLRPVEERLIATGTVLDHIVAGRRARIAQMRAQYAHLLKRDLPPSTHSFSQALRTRSGQHASAQPALILECKSASPSRGSIRDHYDPAALASAYLPWASAISVLTEPDHFNGKFADLAAVRQAVDVPLLCKDFIVDPLQVLIARALGADAILLMLSVVPDDVYRELSHIAHDLGMEVLTEVSTPEEMYRASQLGAHIIGINNRNLRTLHTDIARTQELAPLAPSNAVLVGESGVQNATDVQHLAGLVDALLIGSALSGADNPGKVAQELAHAVPTHTPAHKSARTPSAAKTCPPTPPAGTPTSDKLQHPRLSAYFGNYGGQYVPELLIPALDQLEDAFIDAQADPQFHAEFTTLLHNYLGRPTPITELRNLPRQGNARIFLKREDLVHGGAHKGNQVLGQALLAKRMGKTRIIAETGAGQHGTATAMTCALLGLECTIYMGATDVVRQAANVERMELMGAQVIPVDSGAGTLKDAVNEALRDWTASYQTTHYLLGTAAGPHPFPTLVHEYHRVISTEARAQILALTGRLPDQVIACVGGGSNAIGMFSEFIDDPEVGLIGVEPGGAGLSSGRHGAAINAGNVGILHGSRSYLMRSPDGQVEESFSISAGLDYPGVGPEHAWLADSGRAHYLAITDDEAVAAFIELSRWEGIIPALESAHALAQALKIAQQTPAHAPTPHLLVCLSGRGDKDLEQVRMRLGGSFSTDGAVARAARMVQKMGKRTEYADLAREAASTLNPQVDTANPKERGNATL